MQTGTKRYAAESIFRLFYLALVIARQTHLRSGITNLMAAERNCLCRRQLHHEPRKSVNVTDVQADDAR